MDLVVLGRHASGGHVWHQTMAKVVHAHAGVDDGEDNEDDGDDAETGERRKRGFVDVPLRRLVHADQLEQEVRQGGKIEQLQTEPSSASGSSSQTSRFYSQQKQHSR